MSPPRNSSTNRDGQRTYQWRNEKFFSVTTLADVADNKRPLIGWGIKGVAEGVLKRRNAVTAMLNDCITPKVCATGEFCAACLETARYLKGLPYAQRDAAADLGTAVHAAAEAYSLGQPFPPWSPLVRPRMEAFKLFLEEMEPRFLATEASVYNRTERYAGTLDAIVQMQLPLHENASVYVLDMKSGKAIYPKIAMQLAAYRKAEFIGLPDGSEAPMIPTEETGLGLHLTPEGYRLIEVQADDAVFTAFTFAREIFRWQEQTSKSVLGLEYGPNVQGRVAV